MPIDALLFDLHGTLVDSEHAGLEVVNQMACGLRLAWSLAESQQRFRGVPMPQCASAIVQHLPEGQAELDEVQFLRDLRAAVAEGFRRELQEIPGANALLASLKIAFAVATNGPREKAALTLSLTGLGRWLEGRVFSLRPREGLPTHVTQQMVFIEQLADLQRWL